MTEQARDTQTQAPDQFSPEPELRRLEVFLGEWETVWHVSAGAGLRTYHGRDTYEWMPDGVLMAHHTYVPMHGRDYHIMEIISPYDTASQTYPTHSCDSKGQELSARGRVDDAGVWAFTGDTQCIRLDVSRDRSSITVYGDRLGNDAHWHHWVDIRYTRAI